MRPKRRGQLIDYGMAWMMGILYVLAIFMAVKFASNCHR